MTRYRIYTEWKENLGKLASQYFMGFSIVDQIGYWQGTKEKSAVIEIIGDNLKEKVVSLIADIKHLNNQEAVMLTTEQVDIKLYAKD